MNLNRPTRLEHRLSNAIQIFYHFMQIVKEMQAIKELHTKNHWPNFSLQWALVHLQIYIINYRVTW